MRGILLMVLAMGGFALGDVGIKLVSDDLSLSLLQKRLNDLGESVRVVVGGGSV